MPLTLQRLIDNDLLDELANCFNNGTDANILLTSINFPVAYRPNFAQAGSPMDFWYNVCERIEKGIIAGGFEDLLAKAARKLPGNKTFALYTQLQAASGVSPVPPLTTNYLYPVSVIRYHDAFISYSRQDQDVVKCIARQLKNRNAKVWLDEWELPVGVQFVPEIEKVLEVVPAVVVFYGTQGFGPWQKTEVYSSYDRAFRNKCLLIPVMLPGVRAGDLPPFLKTFNGIAINGCSDHAAIETLANAIKGKNP